MVARATFSQSLPMDVPEETSPAYSFELARVGEILPGGGGMAAEGSVTSEAVGARWRDVPV